MQNIKILGVAFINGLSVTLLVQQLITSNAQALYALKLLRAHGLCSVVLARYLYASTAWCQKVKGFVRRNTRAGFCSTHLSNFTDLCLEADRKLFRKILHKPEHVLNTYSRQFQPLPSVIPLGHAPTKKTKKNRELPGRLSHLVDCNFIVLPVIFTLVDIYVLSIVNCVITVCHCRPTTFHVVSAFCQLRNKTDMLCYAML